MNEREQRVDQSVGGSEKVEKASPGGTREAARKTLAWIVVAIVALIFLVLIVGPILDA